MDWMESAVAQANIKLGFKQPVIPNKNDRDVWYELFMNGEHIECAWDESMVKPHGKSVNWNICQTDGSFSHAPGEVQWRFLIKE